MIEEKACILVCLCVAVSHTSIDSSPQVEHSRFVSIVR